LVNKANIVRNLRELNSRYDKARGARDPQYYSKVALIELCGWIETTMDDIVLYCAKKHMTETKNIGFVEKEIIRKTYSFTYDSHFRRMLMRVVGLIKVEELERKVDQIKFDLMKSSLETLRGQRNKEAHTYITGVTPNLTAPSAVMAQFQTVYEGLKNIETCIRRLKM